MAPRTDPMIYRMAGHAMLVLMVGLVAGLFLTFSLLGAVSLWPLPGIEWQVPGSTRGWQAAHVGGILNGVMIAGLALLAHHLTLSPGGLNWCGWGLIYTGWGNTVFYWAGNIADNRGLSAGDTLYGAGDWIGALSYFGGASAMFATFIAVIILARAAFAGMNANPALREGEGEGEG